MTQVDWIHFRKSVRKYKKKSLDKFVLAELKEQFNQVENIIENTEYDIHLIEHGDQVKKVLSGLASKYTYVKAPHYLLLTCMNDQDDIFNLGYVGEQLVKFLTLNNLGTCWVGAKTSKDKFSEIVPIEATHEFSILIAFGEPMAPLEFIRNRKRKDIKEIFFGVDDLNDTDRFIAESILTAPSAVNNQPWRLYLNNGAWDYYKVLPKGFFASMLGNLLILDSGIGLYHLVETAHSFGSNIKFEKMEFHDNDQNYLGTIKVED